MRNGVFVLVGLVLSACSDDPPTLSSCKGDVGRNGDFETYRFDGDSTVVYLLLEVTGPGVGHSTLYDLFAMSIERSGNCVVIDRADDLDYQNTHHNWLDVAIASHQGAEYKLTMEYLLDVTAPDARWRHILDIAYDNGDESERLELVITGGPICTGCKTRLPVVVSEVMLHKRSWRDDNQEKELWIEIWNWSAEAVDLTGYSISPGRDKSPVWSFPSGASIGRHEYRMVAADGQPAQGDWHTDFGLSSKGGSLMLIAPSGLSAGPRKFAETDTDTSWALDLLTGDYIETDPTPGQENPTTE